MTGTFPSPPKGWTVRVCGQAGISSVESNATEELDPASARALLRETARGLLDAMPGLTVGSGSVHVPIGAEPWTPSSMSLRSSDMSGRMIVEVAHGGTVKRVYVPSRKVDGSVPPAAYAAEVDARLDYLVGSGPGKAARSLIQEGHRSM